MGANTGSSTLQNEPLMTKIDILEAE